MGTFEGIVGFCGVVTCGMIVVVGYFWFISSKSYRRYNTPSKDLFSLLNDKKHVLTTSALKDETRQVITMPPISNKSSDRTKSFLAGIVDKKLEDAEKAQGKTELLAGGRDDRTLPIRKETRLIITGAAKQNLHITKLTDFYGNPTYLVQAPLPSQMADHWKGIWQEKIGVIVLVGRLSIDGNKRMDSYFKEKEHQRVQYENFTIMTTRVTAKYGRYHIYNLTVAYASETRELVVIHAYNWLENTVSWALRRDVQTILTIKHEHCRQILNELPGLMFQCKLGTAGSASMLSVYIGYQTWLRCRRVNFYGILQHIRRRRWGAFEITGDSGNTFLLQVQVAYTVMSAMVEFGSTAKVPVVETWIRDVWTADSLKSQKSQSKSLIIGAEKTNRVK